MTRDLHQIFRSGYVTRWHSNPDMAHIRETLAEHHGRVAQIIMAIHPEPTLALIDAALHHDCGEAVAGDLPAPFKRSEPAIAKAHARAEDAARRRMGIDIDLTPVDADWLKLADMMAAYMHAAHASPHLMVEPEWEAQSLAMDRLRVKLRVRVA